MDEKSADVKKEIETKGKETELICFLFIVAELIEKTLQAS